jgi:putative phage-type endonuclease
MTMLYPKTRDEWLALRMKYISSTESAALFGMSPYMTAFELAVIKKATEAPAEYEQNERMTWGLRLQRAIAQGIAEDYGVKVRAISGYATSEASKLGASFDFEIVGIKEGEFTGDKNMRTLYTQHGPGVLEIKNVDGWIFKQQWQEQDGEMEAPAHIEIQVQHQLHCIERAWACIGVLVGGNRQVVLWRIRDEDVGRAITAKVGAFWKLLDRGEMPPVDLPEDAQIIKTLYRYAEPGKVLDAQADDEIRALCAEYSTAQQAEKAAKDAKDSAVAKLLMKIGDAEKVLVKGYSISAGVVGETLVEAYTRKAYRNCRIYTKKATKEKEVA